MQRPAARTQAKKRRGNGGKQTQKRFELADFDPLIKHCGLKTRDELIGWALLLMCLAVDQSKQKVIISGYIEEERIIQRFDIPPIRTAMKRAEQIVAPKRFTLDYALYEPFVKNCGLKSLKELIEWSLTLFNLAAQVIDHGRLLVWYNLNTNELELINEIQPLEYLKTINAIHFDKPHIKNN
jgi:hypothetical protein